MQHAACYGILKQLWLILEDEEVDIAGLQGGEVTWEQAEQLQSAGGLTDAVPHADGGLAIKGGTAAAAAAAGGGCL